MSEARRDNAVPGCRGLRLLRAVGQCEHVPAHGAGNYPPSSKDTPKTIAGGRLAGTVSTPKVTSSPPASNGIAGALAAKFVDNQTRQSSKEEVGAYHVPYHYGRRQPGYLARCETQPAEPRRRL